MVYPEPMRQKTMAVERISNLLLLLLNAGVKLGMEVEWQRKTSYHYFEFQRGGRGGSDGQRNILLKICFAHLPSPKHILAATEGQLAPKM